MTPPVTVQQYVDLSKRALEAADRYAGEGTREELAVHENAQAITYAILALVAVLRAR